jgi:hypothetical protein
MERRKDCNGEGTGSQGIPGQDTVGESLAGDEIRLCMCLMEVEMQQYSVALWKRERQGVEDVEEGRGKIGDG